LTVNSPLWIAGQDKLPPRAAPTVGQHSEEILREAGYCEATIRELQAAGVIG
jgi:crotonobetainyl-CoA:carnitine CoA-transferase CaiB-like acyl-CoA transferase